MIIEENAPQTDEPLDPQAEPTPEETGEEPVLGLKYPDISWYLCYNCRHNQGFDPIHEKVLCDAYADHGYRQVAPRRACPNLDYMLRGN